MKMKLCARWRESGFGYIIGSIYIEDEAGRLLMDDEDMYYNTEKFWRYINKTFIKNSRFIWDRPAVYYKKSRCLEITGIDTKRGKG